MLGRHFPLHSVANIQKLTPRAFVGLITTASTVPVVAVVDYDDPASTEVGSGEGAVVLVP